MSTMKGMYTPLNPQKYLGDPTKIRYLSSWERHFMVHLDQHPMVVGWGSEVFKVQYFNPVKKKVCHYIPDFIIKYQGQNGQIITEVLEIKPKKQSVISKKMSMYDQVQLVINHAKWQAATAVCESHGIKFRVLTEDELFRQAPKKGKK